MDKQMRNIQADDTAKPLIEQEIVKNQ